MGAGAKALIVGDLWCAICLVGALLPPLSAILDGGPPYWMGADFKSKYSNFEAVVSSTDGIFGAAENSLSNHAYIAFGFLLEPKL